MRTYIYPALHGAYGNVFKERTEEEVYKITKNGCYVTVRNDDNEEKKFALKVDRQDEEGKNMNKFHINVAEAFGPAHIKVYCRNQLVHERSIEKSTRTLSYNVIGRQL